MLAGLRFFIGKGAQALLCQRLFQCQTELPQRIRQILANQRTECLTERAG